MCRYAERTNEKKIKGTYVRRWYIMITKLNQDELLEQISKATNSTSDRNHVISNSLKSICKRIKCFNNLEKTQD